MFITWQRIKQLLTREPRAIRGLVIKHEEKLLAVCLEPYLMTQGNDWPELLDRLKGTLATHVAVSVEKGEDPFVGVRKAPARYWEMYEAAAFQSREPISVESVPNTPSALMLRAQYA